MGTGLEGVIAESVAKTPSKRIAFGKQRLTEPFPKPNRLRTHALVHRNQPSSSPKTPIHKFIGVPKSSARFRDDFQRAFSNRFRDDLVLRGCSRLCGPVAPVEIDASHVDFQRCEL